MVPGSLTPDLSQEGVSSVQCCYQQTGHVLGLRLEQYGSEETPHCDAATMIPPQSRIFTVKSYIKPPRSPDGCWESHPLPVPDQCLLGQNLIPTGCGCPWLTTTSVKVSGDHPMRRSDARCDTKLSFSYRALKCKRASDGPWESHPRPVSGGCLLGPMLLLTDRACPWPKTRTVWV